MKTKSQFYSNFKYNPSNKINNQNNLSINDLFNISTENETIKSCGFQSDLIQNLFTPEISNTITQNNKEIIDSIIIITIYEYFNEINQGFEKRVFALSENFNLYELDYSSCIFTSIYSFTSKPKIIESNNILYYFDSNENCLLIENNNIPIIEKLPKIKSFTTDSTNIYFTLENQSNILYIDKIFQLKDLSVNTEQYDFISIPVEDGLIENIFYIKDKIFILTKYSIYKYDSDNKILIKQNDLNLSVYKNSSTLIDDNIIFYTSNGLYSFDGIDIKQIFSNCLNFTKNANFIYFNHKLYIFDVEFKNILFEYNLNKNTITKYKIDNFVNFYIIKNNSCYNLVINCKAENKNQLSIFNDVSTINKYPKQYVKFIPTFLNSNSIKQINKLYVNSRGIFQIKISSEITSTTCFVSDEKQIQSLCLDGIVFYIEIFSDSDFELNSFLINYTEVGE